LQSCPERTCIVVIPRLEVFTIVEGMSALPPKADIRQRSCDVRFVP